MRAEDITETRPRSRENAARSHETLLAHFARAGYARLEPPVLQPVEPFLELSGEDIRRRIFVTQDGSGAELCLRPEFTIPVCRAHSASGSAGPAAYACLGPVFRLRQGEADEFLQAGLESIGRDDEPAADAEILGLAVEALARLDCPAGRVRLGDMGLVHALLDALSVPPAAKRRALRAVAAGKPLAEASAPEAVGDAHAGLLAAIQGQDPKGVRAFVEDVLAIAGISRVGGRSAGEIAERFLARAESRGSGAGGLSGEARAVIERYVAVTGDPDAALVAVRDLARAAGLAHPPLAAALALFEERNGFMAARGLPLADFAFAGGFARNLDYYTGLIFEISDPARAGGRPLVGGGRYDGLIAHLGGTPTPAVGCAFWLDRIAGAQA